MSPHRLADKLLEGQQLSLQEGVALYREADLHTLGSLADARRRERVDPDTVTYLIDRNLNYTNVCVTGCSFCSFHRPPGHAEGYVLTFDELAARVLQLRAIGGTRILMQGGLHPELHLEWYEALLRRLREAFPDIAISAFSPPELEHIAKLEGSSTRVVLQRMREAGLTGLPGGGAEILQDEVRRRVSPRKQSAEGWLRVMSEAHSLGLVTTATMVIGLGESIEHRVRHLEAIRRLQRESLDRHGGGFTAFISWTAQLKNTPLGRSGAGGLGASSHDYLKHLAFGRLFLDNFDHHQASWPTMGEKLAQLALRFGADDLGSTMMEENVVSSGGAARCAMTEEELQHLIREVGLVPAQRDLRYRILKRFD